MDLAQLPQSENAQTVPFITVGKDARGGTCWAVVGLGTVVRCYTGHHAIAVLEMMCAATGTPTPLSQ
jgi:6,7-dimethyl-8-ribityllumazine synthase